METLPNHSANTTQTASCPVIAPPSRLAFTCTFCWRVSSTTPRAVGQSARLACEACYKALLDLSICWVCGEVVVRGDSCVSLGWCFWHKSCYGCLICGNRMVVRGATVKEVFFDESEPDDDNDEDDDPRKARGRAKEIDEIPLCAHCYAEVGDGEMDADAVVNGALRRIDYQDGGLSRSRYEDGLHTKTNASLLAAQGTSGLEQERCQVPLESRIYVSIRDPTAPAFKPSPTKSIPSWMMGAPTIGDEINDGEHKIVPTPGDHLPQLSPAELSLHRGTPSYSPSIDHAVKPQTPTSTPELMRLASQLHHLSSPATPQIAIAEPIPVASPKILRFNRLGYINSESLKRPSSRLDRIREESSQPESRTPSPYLTPPEWPESMYASQAAAQRTLGDATGQEYFGRYAPGPTSIFSETSLHTLSSLISPRRTSTPSQLPRLSIASEPSTLPQHPRLSRKSTMLRAKIAAHHPPAGPSAVPMTSEFLERYGLINGRRNPQPSALLKKTPPSSRRSSREPQAIMARMTRNSRSTATTGLVDETTVVTVTERSATPEQLLTERTTGSIALYDGPVLDTTDLGTRRSLQAELKRVLHH